MDLEVFKVLAEALALGLLVGVERYRGRDPGEKKSAGVRTFAIFAVLGAVCGILDEPSFTLVTFAALAALLIIGYYRYSTESLGSTTEFAALLVFWIGYLLNTHEAAAISLGIVLTIFLASKRRLHDFVKEQISEAEFDATLKFLAVVLVIYPILPDRNFGPYGFLNPREIWGLVILVSTIGYAGYFLVRWFGTRRGLKIAALAGGLVSTTAATMALAQRAKAGPGANRAFAGLALLANSPQGPRLLFLIWVVDRVLGNSLMLPLLGMGVAGLLTSGFMFRRTDPESEIEFTFQNPFSLMPALKFGALFVAILLLVQVANAWLGEKGILLASALAGLGSTSAAALSVAGLVKSDGLALSTAGQAIFLAIATNSLTKWVLSLVQGTRALAWWLGGGLLLMVGAGAVLLLLSNGVPS